MKLFIAVAVALVGCALANDDPDGVREKLVVKNCNPKSPITIKDVQIQDANGKEEYPIVPGKPFTLLAHSVDAYNGPIRDLRAKVELYTWSSRGSGSWSSWSFVNRFLTNLDGCNFGHNCPLTPGPLVIDSQITLGKLSWIVKLLSDKQPYKLIIRLLNGDVAAKPEMACIQVETMLKT